MTITKTLEIFYFGQKNDAFEYVIRSEEGSIFVRLLG